MARKSRFDDKVSEMDLVPIMNMVMCLIPVVLAGSAAVQIGIVNVNAPKFGMGTAATPEDDAEKPLNLTVAVGEDGFRITASGADINEILGTTAAAPVDGAAPQGPLIPKKAEKYDYLDLYNKLVTVKKAFPEETIVNLTADARIQFKFVIAVMDVLRVRLEQDAYDDLDAFTHAGLKYDGIKPELLWPDVVFAVAQ